MTKQELCNICTEYSVKEKCENMSSCELQKILIENKKLKSQIKELKCENRVLKKQLDEARIRESWEKYPDRMGR